MNVPFVDLKAHHKPISKDLSDAIARVLQNTSFIQGPEVKAFEEAFARYLGVAHCVAVNSGTAALHLTLMALGIGPGDEVITVPHTFIATSEAISAVGARPVFVDVDPVTYTMDPALVEAAITARTRAILPVHLYGNPADMDALLAIARRHNLALVEDACQAHGAHYKGHMAGTMGVAGCFSFYPSKNLGSCGEGGAMATNDEALAKRIRMLREHGSVKKYEHSFPGFNFRMEGIQGAVLATKLNHLDGWNDQRRTLARRYGERLAGQPIVLPKETSDSRHVYHLYVIQTDDREALREFLAQRGIETGLHYPVPLHLQEAYASLGYRAGDFPITERVTQRILSLPMYPEMSMEAADYVSNAVLEYLRVSSSVAVGHVADGSERCCPTP
jgi:dTDP-4-amino-4,6-dideoxygalactose transaminase